MEQSVKVSREGGVATVMIDRPKALNALDVPTLLELEQAMIGLNADRSVRAIVFRGGGSKAFVAGGDIADLTSRQGLAHYLEFAEVIHRVFRLIETVDKPTIGAVSGWCLGGGTELLLCLDFRIVGASAKIGLPEVKLGLFPGAGGSQRLIRQISQAQAKELMFLGEPISSERALAFGLVNQVVPDEEVVRAAQDLGAALERRSPLVLKLLKRTIREGMEMPLASALAHEQAMIGLVLDSKDSHEGCAAFLEKRTPNFTGE